MSDPSGASEPVAVAPEGKEGKAEEGKTDGAKRFVVKKWNAVALWAWGELVSLVLPQTRTHATRVHRHSSRCVCDCEGNCGTV
jgi:hypothetical protein